MADEKQDGWSDAGKLMGRAMLLVAPVTAVFTIGVAWSQLTDRQDRLRRDVTELRLLLKDEVMKGREDIVKMQATLIAVKTYLDTSGPDFERRIEQLERKVLNGAKP